MEGPCVFIGPAYRVGRTLLSAAFDLSLLSLTPASSAARQEVAVILSEAKDLCTLSAAPAISPLRLVVIRGIEVDGASNGHHAAEAGHALRPEI